MSDLHLEFYNDNVWKPTPNDQDKDTVLLLAGDIGVGLGAKGWITEMCTRYRNVVYVLGNHEYYNSTICMEDINALITNLCNLFQNVVFLNNSTYKYKYICDNKDKEIIFLGSTLWSLILPNERNRIKQVSSDLCNINFNNKVITIDQINKIHKNNVEWIQATLDSIQASLDSINNSDTIVIVLTHHLPSYKAIAPKYNPMNPSNEINPVRSLSM